MDFIDKLEQFLLRPRAKVYHDTSRFEGSDKVFFDLGCFRRNYGQQDKEVKKDGILSMMKKLRDNTYQHPQYTDFYLDLIGWDYFEDILKLEPTNEDLFNLYKAVGYGKDNKLTTFLRIVKDREWKLKFFKHGHDYRLDWHGHNQLRGFVENLQDLNLSDDEWIDALGAYITNSIGLRERERQEELIEICIGCIKDNSKCEKFIKDFFNETVNLSTLFITNTVKQLKVDSKNIVKRFGYRNNGQVTDALQALYTLIKFNLKEISHITNVEYYSVDTEHNFILYNDHDGKGIDFIKELVNEMIPVFKDIDLGKNKRKGIIKDYNETFIKILSYVNHLVVNDEASWLCLSNK